MVTLILPRYLEIVPEASSSHGGRAGRRNAHVSAEAPTLGTCQLKLGVLNKNMYTPLYEVTHFQGINCFLRYPITLKCSLLSLRIEEVEIRSHEYQHDWDSYL